jgi:hypothetical protein
VQRRHSVRRYGWALARRPRSPSTPPGPHPAARRGLRSRAGCSRCAYAPPRRHTAGFPVYKERGQIRPLPPVTLLTRDKIHHAHHALRLPACHERNNGPLSLLRLPALEVTPGPGDNKAGALLSSGCSETCRTHGWRCPRACSDKWRQAGRPVRRDRTWTTGCHSDAHGPCYRYSPRQGEEIRRSGRVVAKARSTAVWR